MTACASCQAEQPTDPAVICPACTRGTRLDLLEIPGLLQLLDDATARLDRIDRPGGGGPGDIDPDQGLPLTAASTRLPFNPAAGQAAMHLTRLTALWASAVYDAWPLTRRPPTGRTAPAWLAGRVHLLRWHPEAATARAEITAAVHRARALVDRPGESWWAGVCGTPLDDPDHPGTTVDCGWDLRAAPGATSTTCRGCGTRHDLAERRDRMLDAAAERLLTGTQAARALSGLGHPVAASTVWSWRHRGRLQDRGVNAAGQPLYRLGDVRALANLARYGATTDTGRTA